MIEVRCYHLGKGFNAFIPVNERIIPSMSISMISWLGFLLGITCVTNKVIVSLIKWISFNNIILIEELLYMSDFFNRPTVGIDVSADFSIVAILSPDGQVFKKPFKVSHDFESFKYLSSQIKEVEKAYGMKTGIFMESTGVYHISLFHFLKSEFDTYIINPLITNSNKNNEIRKVKNDKKDSLTIARLGKFHNLKTSAVVDVNIFTLKMLLRDYFKLVDYAAGYKKKLSADLRIIFPNYLSVFSNPALPTSIAILKKYPTPDAILNASKEDLMILLNIAKKGAAWSNQKHKELMASAESSYAIGIYSRALAVKIKTSIDLIEVLENQADTLLAEIKAFVNSENISEYFRKNLELLDSIPGFGYITALTVMSEIGDIKGFLKPKHLVAFLGLDASVSQSGKFTSSNNKISKRGSNFARRALYAVALASVRNSKTGHPINPVLQSYYKQNMTGKAKKVGLVAVMHKIVKYIFAVLRDQTPYEVREPKIHSQMHLRSKSIQAA